MGAAIVVVSALVAGLIPADHVMWRVVVVALGVAVFAACAADLLASAAVVVLAALVVNGFLIDRLGELSWHGRPDLYRAAMLMAAGLVGWLAGDLARVVLRARQRPLERALWRELEGRERRG